MSVFKDYQDWLDEETDDIIKRHATYAAAELKLGGEVGDYYVDASKAFETNDTSCSCEKCIIATTSDVHTWVNLRTALAVED